MPNLCRLVYVSEAARPLAAAQLERLVEIERLHNEAVGITGILVAGAGQYVQVLEGELEDVAARFDALRADPRHRNARRVVFEFAADRMFPSCRMGFVDADRAAPAERARVSEMARLGRALPGAEIGEQILAMLLDFKVHVVRPESPALRAAG